MDGYQFMASLFASAVTLGWPIAAVILGFLFRRPILALLGRITSVKAGGVEMTVAERSAEAVEELRLPVPATIPPFEHLPDPETGQPVEDVSPDEIVQIGELTAESTILREWLRLGKALMAANEGPKTVGQSAMDSARQLHAAGTISSSAVDSVDQLRRIRNDVVHGRTTVRLVDSMAYSNAVDNVVEAVTGAKRDPRNETAYAIRGQGELATKSFEDVVRRLEERFRLERR